LPTQRQVLRHCIVLETYGNRWRATSINIRGVIAVIFARRGVEGISIVSMRPASEKERAFYETNRR
jgi:hypothetical protein